METKEEIEKILNRVQFLSPNEPITEQGVMRVIDQISRDISLLEDASGVGTRTITMWSPNIQYKKGDLVLYFK